MESLFDCLCKYTCRHEGEDCRQDDQDFKTEELKKQTQTRRLHSKHTSHAYYGTQDSPQQSRNEQGLTCRTALRYVGRSRISCSCSSDNVERSEETDSTFPSYLLAKFG